MIYEIEKAVEYLKQVSIGTPVNIQVEETEFLRVVLSYKECDHTISPWSRERHYKEFNFKDGKVVSMYVFNPPKQ